MPTFDVYGFNPSGGPSEMSAKATRDNFNEDHPTWNVTLTYTASSKTARFASTTAPSAELKSALEKQYPSASYHVVEV